MGAALDRQSCGAALSAGRRRIPGDLGSRGGGLKATSAWRPGASGRALPALADFPPRAASALAANAAVRAGHADMLDGARLADGGLDVCRHRRCGGPGTRRKHSRSQQESRPGDQNQGISHVSLRNFCKLG
jgi:hypothetical protein